MSAEKLEPGDLFQISDEKIILVTECNSFSRFGDDWMVTILWDNGDMFTDVLSTFSKKMNATNYLGNVREGVQEFIKEALK